MDKEKQRRATDTDGWTITQDEDGVVRIYDNQGWLHAKFRHEHINTTADRLTLLRLWRYISAEVGAKIDDEIAKEFLK